MKDFNALIDIKSFFDQPVKNKEKAYEKLIEIIRNSYYTDRRKLINSLITIKLLV